MRKLLILLALLLIGSCAGIKQVLPSVARADIMEDGGVVGHCTAFAVSGYKVLTSAHCCPAQSNAGIKVNNKFGWVLERDEVNDICAVIVIDHGLKPLEIAKRVQVGDKVFVVGCPMAHCGSITQGWTAKPTEKWTVITAASTFGSSGSPVLNTKNEVIGIVSRGPEDYNNLVACSKLHAIKKILK